MPESFEGWSDFFPRYTELPWLNGREHRRVQVMREYLADGVPAHPDWKAIEEHARGISRLAGPRAARWRLDNDVYGLPAEVWLKNLAATLSAPAKPVVDAQRLSTETVTC